MGNSCVAERANRSRQEQELLQFAVLLGSGSRHTRPREKPPAAKNVTPVAIEFKKAAQLGTYALRRQSRLATVRADGGVGGRVSG